MAGLNVYRAFRVPDHAYRRLVAIFDEVGGFFSILRF